MLIPSSEVKYVAKEKQRMSMKSKAQCYTTYFTLSLLSIYLPYINKIRSFLQLNNLFLYNQALLLDMCDAFVASQGMVCTRFKIRSSVLKTFEINIMEVVRNADWGGQPWF